ncbi:MAG: filamentous hemagglutinin N-terminal domain-containing protein [Pseudomonadota bacterium]
MLTKTTIPILLSSLLLSSTLSAAPGGGLLADHTAGTTLNLQDQTIAITGGTIRGGNLLYSFQEFNVETGQTADFRTAPDTQYIISRVTGPNDSWIDGRIKSTTSNADLYLVNPNGIMMGENASLDVQGAFHVTTADYVTLADGQQVYADPDQGVTLTVAAPEAFGFLDADVGQIQIEGSQLHVADGKDIRLVGGEIMIKADAELQAVGGHVDLIAVGSEGEAQLTPDRIHNTTAPADIIFDNSQVNVSNEAESTRVGGIRVQGARIIAFDSSLLADNNSRIDAADYDGVMLQAKIIKFSDSKITTVVKSTGQGGSIQLQATGQLELSNNIIEMSTYSDVADAGAGGDLDITAPTIILTESDFDVDTDSSGSSGLVRLEATEQVVMDNSRIYIGAYSDAADAGAGGNLEIVAPTIILADGVQISVDNFGNGQAGSVRLEATEQVVMNNSLFYMTTEGDAADAGAGGDLEITAPTIILEYVEIDTPTLGIGQGGSVWLEATEQVVMSGGSIDVYTENAGAGGNLEIMAPTIILEEASIGTYTSGSGRGGSVRLEAAEQVVISDFGIEMETSGVGASSNLEIMAPTIILEDMEIGAYAFFDSGSGGSVRLEATEQVVINDSRIDMATYSEYADAGKGGDLEIMAPMISLSEDTKIVVATTGSGQGGSVWLKATDQILLSGQSTRISSSSHGMGAAGSVQTQADSLILVDGAKIESTSGLEYPDKDRNSDFPRTGDAGQIRIDLSGVLHMSGGGQITTSTAGIGDAGDIRIGEQNRPTALYMADGAQITSGSESDAEGAGAAGRLVILTGEQIQMQGSSALTTESQNAGGGGIRVETRDLLHLQDSQITTSVQGGDGRGGDIQIDPVFVILENSQIQANAHGGAGGNITLVADYLLRSGASVIEASSALSTSGEIDVQAVDVDAGSLQATTQIVPLNVAQWAQAPCHLRRGKISRLIMAGYDAHPTAVDDVLSALPLYTGLQRQQPVPDAATGPVIPQTRFMSPAEPLTIQHGYLLAAAGTDAGCSVL